MNNFDMIYCDKRKDTVYCNGVCSECACGNCKDCNCTECLDD